MRLIDADELIKRIWDSSIHSKRSAVELVKESKTVLDIDKMNKKLNPCTCGGKPILLHVGDCKTLFVYSCSECGYTAAEQGEGRLTERGARKLWNKRVKV